jgi:heptaprenyl diphosphate synthase
MTPSLINDLPGKDRDIRRAAALVATACVLQVAESLIPHPIPGVRLGLANMVTLVALVELGLTAALEVALLRTVVSSLVLGTFLTPGFILSFCSAAASTLVMWGLWRFSSRFPAWGLSLIGVSVASAVAHNASQLGLAYLLMVRHPGIFYFAPWLVISGVVMGWLTGLVAAEVVRGSCGNFAPSLPGLSDSRPAPAAAAGGSLAHRLAPEWKIAWAVAALALSVAAGSWRGFLLIGAGILTLMIATGLPFAQYRWMAKKMKGLAWLASISFFFPLLFTFGAGDILFSAGPLEITRQGFASGSVFAMRIMVMGCIAFLLNIYSSPAEIAAGISKLGRPLGRFGFPADRIGAVISLSWGEIPAFTVRAREAVKAALSGQGRRSWRQGPLDWMVKLAAGVVAGMCRDSAGTDGFETTAA